MVGLFIKALAFQDRKLERGPAAPPEGGKMSPKLRALCLGVASAQAGARAAGARGRLGRGAHCALVLLAEEESLKVFFMHKKQNNNHLYKGLIMDRKPE